MCVRASGSVNVMMMMMLLLLLLLVVVVVVVVITKCLGERTRAGTHLTLRST